MASFSLNTSIFRTRPGLFKVAELAFVLIVRLMARFGSDGHPKDFGSQSTNFFGSGTTVGFAIIMSAVLLTRLLGSNLSILELVVNVLGAVPVSYTHLTLPTKRIV